jgi:hypothetical protein
MTEAMRVTPRDLADAKICIDVTGRKYSHVTQTGVDQAGAISTITWNATQTYNTNGQPKDSDNDK